MNGNSRHPVYCQPSEAHGLASRQFTAVFRLRTERIDVRLALVLFLVTAADAIPGGCQEGFPPGSPNSQAESAMRRFTLPNLSTPTLGGKQLWTDYHWRRNWRIQKNAISGHWRLLDPRNVRQAWGRREDCQRVLEERVPETSLAKKNIVVVLHGLGRTTNSMAGLARSITKTHDCIVVPFQYASTRAPISQHADALRQVIAGLPADSQLSFISHSLGGIVVRHALGDWQAEGNEEDLHRVKHIVMLGPPNQGSALARLLSKTGFFGFVAGSSSLELGRDWRNLEEKLATPTCPFGIIAGSTVEAKLSNPWLRGDSDLVVAVDETRLVGAEDFLIVDGLHTFLMDYPQVQRAVSNFLDHDHFE